MSERKGNPGRPEGADGREMLARMNRSHAPLRAFGFEGITWRPGMRILDVGCGGGATIAEMLALSADSVIDGVDYAPESVESSKQTNAAYLGTRCAVRQGDAGALPYGADTFDLVTAVETVYFWPDLDAGIREALRVLKPGGIFAVLCETEDTGVDWPPITGVPFTVYTADDIAARMIQTGFSETGIRRSPQGYIAVYGVK